MLKLKDLTKEYRMPDGEKIYALDGISVNFRKNEFVAVLGPSGCGKTTTLNIVGGLDRYTSGDLQINGVSTKQYKDKDWDVYRNHSIGFVFQSYNLIPHQTILGNVELALTIGGVSKAERVQRAKDALDRVGLAGQYYKRPNQLSGGQMQRVAIARALVNDPEIILADEPTGALDTKTSMQVMDLLQEVASDRLVIMVTHNPELAEKYATRIIRLLDGKIVGDSRPYTDDELASDLQRNAELLAEAEKAESENSEEEKGKKQVKAKKKNKAKMSLSTTFRLSAQNLLTKKKRTIMTSIAGAIGIIGVSLVLAVSYGVQAFIYNMQNDMLSGNPIKIEQTAFDMSALSESLSTGEKNEIVLDELKDGEVGVDGMVEELIKASNGADTLQVSNTITKEYIDYVQSIPKEYSASVFLNYGLDVGNNIYTDFTISNNPTEGEVITRAMSLSSIRSNYIAILENHSEFAKYATYITSIVDNFQQAPVDKEYVSKQYNVDGEIASKENEIMIVLNSKDELADVLFAQLGYYTQEEFMNIVYKGASGNSKINDLLYDESLNKDRFTVSELKGKKFYYYPNDTVYTTSDMSIRYQSEKQESWQNPVEFTVTGVLTPKEGLSYGSLTSGFYYTEEFAKRFIEDNKNSEIVKFLSDNGASSYPVYRSVQMGPSSIMMPIAPTYDLDYYYYDFDFSNEEEMNEIIAKIEDEENPQMPKYSKHTEKNVILGTTSALGAIVTIMGGSSATQPGGSMSGMLSALSMPTLSIQQLGGNELPQSIALYQEDFDKKQHVLDYLEEWNDLKRDVTVNGKVIKGSEREKIVYSDMLTLVIGMINQFIDIITIALIAFTSLALVVSTFMIAIITYVSVVERIKEIGVIRSLGGRKKDVSRLFTAETVIIGLISGLFGIGITYLGCLLINSIVTAAAGIGAIAVLPIPYALIMIGISVLLTLVSGVFPARAAAKKDPVVALRTE